MSRTILGKRPALAAEGKKQVFSSPNSVLTSPCEHPNDLWTQPKVSSEEKASRLPPIRSLFFHHFDWNRWLASLATTVDNTIKMADRSFKHGRQWCIRRISREVEFSGCPGTRQCLGTKGAGYKSVGWACALPLLFLCFQQVFSWAGKGSGWNAGDAWGRWRGMTGHLFYCVYLLWLEAECSTHSGLTDNIAYICLYILHNANDAGYVA